MTQPKEGDLFKTISLGGKTFEIKYGYYEDYEREREDPIPIYPDFINNPCYSEDGKPFITQMQDMCEHGTGTLSDGFCIDCEHFCHGEDLIGFCNLIKNDDS